jgi:AcrR family transcriptional regulator
MSDAGVRTRPGGRSARVRASVLQATLDALAEVGIDQLTIAEVADRAGVHETSIRRRWRTREKLVCDALLNYSSEHLPIPDTGSLREDLVVFARQLADYDATALGRALLQAVASGSEDPELEQARNVFWLTRYDLASVMIDRAVARGELRGEVDARLVLEAIVAPVHFRTLLTHEPAGEDFPSALVDLVLDGARGI